MKKNLAVICMVVLALSACAFPAADAEESSESIAGAEELKGEESGEGDSEAEEAKSEEVRTHSTGSRAGTENEDAHSYNDAANVPKEMRSEEESIRAQQLYEIFLNQEYAGYENYAYVMYDADGDNCKELYIKRDSQESFYAITYVNGGLCIEYPKEIPSEVNGVPWTGTETLAEAQNGEMAHSGIYVYVNRDNFWYPDEASFVAANGFDKAEPFFEYFVPDGSKRLSFYYDEAAQKGCGIRYYERDPSTFMTTGMYGFVFEGLQEGREAGIREDYLKPEVYNGSNASEYVENFTENTEYDEKGRITHYDAGGTFMRDRSMEYETILWIDYAYYGNGNLKSRSYWHAGLLFGSTCTTWSCCFDEQGRIAYEDSYITHGSYDTYYIYMDDTKEPAYILNLDNCMGEWIPEFRKGK